MEVLSSRVLYGSGDFDSLRRFYEGTVGLHVYRQYGPRDAALGVVCFLGGGFPRDHTRLYLLAVDHPVASGAGRWR